MNTAELQERLAAGEADPEIGADAAAALATQSRQIINDELAAAKKYFKENPDRQLTCGPGFLAQLRFAAFIHNCSRYNRLHLLKFINRPRGENGQRSQSPMFHHIDQNARGCCGLLGPQVGPKASAWIMITIIWLFVAFFPFAYVEGKKDVDGKLADFIRQYGVWAGLLFMMGVLFMTSILQLIFGPKLPIDQPKRYKMAFFVYYSVYKWWQAQVILKSMPDLVYNNLCLVKAPGKFAHVGIFVVGIAVNTIQCLWLMVGAIMLLAVRKTTSLHAVATDFAVAWVIAYAMHRATVFAIGLLLGQSKVYIARINHKIDQADKHDEQRGGYDGMLRNMINNSELVVRRRDLERLVDFHEVVRPEDIPPSATCVRRVTIVLNDGTHYEVDLADGSTHRLF